MKGRALTIVTVVGVCLIVGVEFAKGSLSELLGLSHETVVRVELGSVVLLLLIVLNLVFHLSAAQSEEAVAEVTSQLSAIRATSGRLTLLSSAELYRELMQAANSARHRIYNTYLGDIPPTDSNLPEKHNYFKASGKLATKKKGVVFRRIIALSQGNLNWIEKLVKEHAGQSNVSIAVYAARPGSVKPISIQLFDNTQVVIVHAASRPPGQARDIAITDPTVVSLLDDYYDDLWDNSQVVLDAGRPDSEVLRALSLQLAAEFS